MRYFLLVLGVIVITVMVVAGKRGDMSRRPPIELFPDMDRQPKLRPQEQQHRIRGRVEITLMKSPRNTPQR